MVEFRKWLIAFAVVAAVLVASAPAHAQVLPPTAFTCIANAGTPPIVRAEGITELVGDVVLQCSGGAPTPVGAAVPLQNVTVFLNTNITSRLVGGSFANGSEAEMPIDAPGTTAVRTIRMTNVRGNACQLGTSSTLIPTQIVMFISVNGSQQVTINNPQQTVAFIQPGLVTGGTSRTELQCNSLNNTLLGSSSNTTTDRPGFLTATEGFASSFKARGYAQPPAVPANTIGQAAATLQNVPGFPYNTE